MLDNAEAAEGNQVVDYKGLNPDGYSRFHIMAYLLELLYKGSRKKLPIKVLDVGGASPYMMQALELLNIEFQLTVIDIIDYREKSDNIVYVQGDATSMPFEDASFDVVISTDVLEHISGNKKEKFVSESLRVCKDFCIIAGPFDTPGVDFAEHELNDLNVKLFGVGQEWLEEHFKYSKPRIEEVTKVIKDHKLDYELIGTHNLYMWLIGASFNLMEAKVGINADKIKDLNDVYAKNIYTAGEVDEPSYRHFMLIYKDAQKLNLKKKIEADFHTMQDYSAAVTYLGGLLNIFAERLMELKTSLVQNKDNCKKLKEELNDNNARLIALQSELDAQAQLLRVAGPYLKLRNKRLVKKLIKPQAEQNSSVTQRNAKQERK